jgi:hypothetical protein
MKRDGGCTQIIVALIGAVGVILAAVLGGPLLENWLDKDNNGGGGGNGGSVPGSVIQVSASANPNPVAKGKMTEISVFTQAPDGSPLPGVIVTVESGGGIFQATGTTTASGQTGPDGLFRTMWSCASCAPEYVMQARANKPNFNEGRREFSVLIK